MGKHLEFCENGLLRKCKRRDCYYFSLCVCGLSWDWIAFRNMRLPQERLEEIEKEVKESMRSMKARNGREKGNLVSFVEGMGQRNPIRPFT